MALLWIDGCSHYSSTNDKTYTGYSFGTSSTTRRSGARSIRCQSSVRNVTFQKPIELTDRTVIVGGAIYVPVTIGYGDNARVFAFEDSNNDDVCEAWINQDTSVSIYYDNTLVGTTDVGKHNVGEWHYYELKYVKDTTNGLVELRMDGDPTPVLTYSGDTETATGDVTRVGLPNNTGDFVTNSQYIMDIYILDGSGSENNDYLGDIRVDTHYPNGDNSVDFTPSSGTSNYLLLDEQFSDNDTTFVESGTVLAKDLYSMNNLTLTTQIYGVQLSADMRKTDSGTVTTALISNDGVNNTVWNTQQIGDNYSMEIGIRDTDPSDNTAWTDAKVNATGFGFRIDGIEP